MTADTLDDTQAPAISRSADPAQLGVELRPVSKNFGRVQALDDVSAEIRPGHLTGLVGPDGAGKTTLMRLMAGLLAPTDGEVIVEGLNTRAGQASIALLTGYMPQRFGLYEDLSVIENLRLYGAAPMTLSKGPRSSLGTRDIPSFIEPSRRSPGRL